MFKKPSLAQLLFLLYFLILLSLRIFKNIKYFSLSLVLDNLYLLLGGFFGWFLLKLDRLIDAYFVKPERPLSLAIRQLVKKNQPLRLFRFLQEHKREQGNLVFRSAIFQSVWLVLALFTISSTDSLFGKGLVLGLGLHLLFDEWKDYYSKGLAFVRDWLFWQVKREVSLKEAKVFLGVMSFAFILLTLMMV